MDPGVPECVSEPDLSDVILAVEDTYSILTDNADRAIQGNLTMHVTHPVNLVVKF